MKNTFLAVFFLLAYFGSVAQDKTISKSFSNIKKIRLRTSSGDIILRKSAGSEVKVNLKYDFDDDEYKPVIEAEAGRLTLEEKFANGSHSGNASWTLEVPDNISININTGSGNLEVDQLAIDIKSNTGSGDITLSEVKGVLDFNTGSGNIELEKTDGEVTLNTGSGNIRAQKGTGSFSFNAGSGNMRLDGLKGDMSINVGSGDINVKGVTVTGRSLFNSGSGNVTVNLGAPLEGNITVNSGSGGATLNFNGNEISGTIIMTANKRNGNIVAPFKFDKEETLDEKDNGNARIQKTVQIGVKPITITVGTGSGTAEIVK